MYQKNTIIVKRITNFEREKYTQHLIDLDADDRYMRFGHNVKDASIQKYVAETDLKKDGVFGAFTENLEAIGIIHLFLNTSQKGIKTVEVSMSVCKAYRKQGIAYTLAKRAWIWCEAQNIDVLELQWLTNNPAVSKMVKHFGGKIEGQAVEYDAQIQVEGKRIAVWKNWFLNQVELLHYGWNYNHQLWKQIKKQLPNREEDLQVN